jgi:hypothetical protein
MEASNILSSTGTGLDSITTVDGSRTSEIGSIASSHSSLIWPGSGGEAATLAPDVQERERCTKTHVSRPIAKGGTEIWKVTEDMAMWDCFLGFPGCDFMEAQITSGVSIDFSDG